MTLITGANKGIGFEIARQLGRDHGMTVLVGARDQTRGRETVEKLTTLGISARAVQLDVTDRSSVETAKAQIEREFGRLDVLVNNAGVALDRSAPSETDLDKFKATHETNVFGPLLVTRTMLPLLRLSPVGRIVNMSSGLGSLSQNNDSSWEFSRVKLVAYNSSKRLCLTLPPPNAAYCRLRGFSLDF